MSVGYLKGYLWLPESVAKSVLDTDSITELELLVSFTDIQKGVI